MKTFKPKVPGFLIGIKIVIVNMLKTLSPFHSKPNVNYPFEKEKVAPRARGVIALDQEACTSCMLCARQCPDWCINIEHIDNNSVFGCHILEIWGGLNITVWLLP